MPLDKLPVKLAPGQIWKYRDTVLNYAYILITKKSSFSRFKATYLNSGRYHCVTAGFSNSKEIETCLLENYGEFMGTISPLTEALEKAHG